MTPASTTRYDRTGAQLLALLLSGAVPGDAGRMRHRLGEEEPRFLTWVPLSDEARAHAARDPDVRVRRALVRANGLTEDDLAALLERPDPVVDQAVYGHAAALPWMRRRVLAPGRHPATALAPLLARIRATTQDPPGQPRYLGAAVVSEVPEVTEHALRTCGPALTTAEQLRGVLQLFAHPARLRTLLDDAAGAPAPLLRTAVADAARAALDDGTDAGAGRLRAAVAAAEGAEGLTAGLRAGEAEPLWRQHLDWDTVLTGHQENPLPEPVVRALAARPDCPEPVLVDLYRTHPTAVADAARPCPAVLRAAARTPAHPELARLAADVRNADEETGASVLDAVAPARTAALTLAALGPGAAGPLRARLRRHLGADPGRWATLRAALSRYRGTLAALLADIADGTVPEPAPTATMPALAKPYRFLLFAADPDDLRDLLPHIPGELLHALLAKGSLPPHALPTALAAADPRVRAAVGHNVALDVRELRRLTEGDEPTVNAAVYRNQKATLSLRRAIASGAPRTPGRTEPVPLDPALRAELCTDSHEHLCAPLVTSGDPPLVRRAWRFLSGDAQRYAVIRVWERGGPGAVRELLTLLPEYDVPPQIVPDTLVALDHPDGVAHLRATAEPYEDPETLPGIFAAPRGRNATRRLMRTIVREPYVHDFECLIAAHHEHGFQPEPVEELLRHEDADEPVRFALTAPRLPARRADAEPIAYLRDASYGPRGFPWFARAARHGLLAPERLVDTARPALPVLTTLQQAGGDDEDVHTAARRSAVDLAREHLAGHPDAWAVALQLLGTFAGTLAELITVAAQVAGPRPDAGELARLDASRHAADARTAAQEPAPTPPAPQMHTVDRRRLDEAIDTGAAVGAVDLLRSLDPEAPVPTDPDVLKSLASTHASDIPGLVHPDWLAAACRAHAAPETLELLAERTRQGPDGHPGTTVSALAACRNGRIAPSAMVARRRAEELDPLPKSWFSRGKAAVPLRAARHLVADRLGADPVRWLRALAAMDTPAAGRPFGDLLEYAAATPTAADAPWTPILTPAAAGLLLHADTDALAAVLPRLDPDAATTLTTKACERGHVTDALVDHLFAADDRAALLVLARSGGKQCDRIRRLRLLTLDDPAVNHALYGGSSSEIRRIILSRRPQGSAAGGPDGLLPLAPQLRVRLLGNFTFIGRNYLHEYRVAVEAADAEIVEHALTSWGKHVPLPDHLLAARNALRHGGPDHLRSLIDRGLLSVGAAKVAAKALAAPDGDAVLTARLDRELSPQRLVTKLRAATGYSRESEELLDLPYVRDWDVLVRAHREQPFPLNAWHALGRLPDAPEDVAADAVVRWSPIPARALAHGSARLARAALAHSVGQDERPEFAALLDAFLERGLLTADDLLHRTDGANRVLHYLGETALRQELPTPVRSVTRAATEELAALLTRHLGTDRAAWQRLFAALTRKDPHWPPMPGSPATVGALLTHVAKEPMAGVR
ncbi:hypothetical protein [Streptomyces sp. NPDC048638]|uniref:hypothetical protein n=1 Tax=Streptomyces sp. NPDC048638 TaxID=3365580 RepID=UPI003719D03E